MEENMAESASAQQQNSTAPADEPLDHKLCQSFVDGNQQAYEQLYRRHYHRVYALCLRMTGNATEAEDLTQEIFIVLFNKAGSFRGDSAFTTWLHRLTVNQVLMHFRKQKRRRETITTDENALIRLSNEMNRAQFLPMVDRIALHRAMDQLPPGYRNALVLHDLQGFDHKEIAARRNCAEGTSKSQLNKARRKMRSLLGAVNYRGLQTLTV